MLLLFLLLLLLLSFVALLFFVVCLFVVIVVVVINSTFFPSFIIIIGFGSVCIIRIIRKIRIRRIGVGIRGVCEFFDIPNKGILKREDKREEEKKRGPGRGGEEGRERRGGRCGLPRTQFVDLFSSQHPKTSTRLRIN